LGEAELEEFCNFDDTKIIVMETELIAVQWTSKQYLNFMLAVLARRMVEKLDVCMGAYVVLQSDFV
jgi:hypothetical protein